MTTTREADFGDNAEIVGDEEDGHAELGLEGAEKVEDLGLDGDVEGGGGLVGDEEAGLAGEGDGDHDALAHAAGDLVGVGGGAAVGVGDADELEELDGARGGGEAGEAGVGAEALGDLLADGHDGVEAGHGFLEDHADAGAADLPHVGGCSAGEVDAFEPDAAAGDATGGRGREEAHDGERGDGFAGAGFADDGEGFAGIDVEGDVIDGADGAGVGGKVDLEVADFEEVAGRCRVGWGFGQGGAAEPGRTGDRRSPTNACHGRT